MTTDLPPILLLHHHNSAEAGRAELVSVERESAQPQPTEEPGEGSSAGAGSAGEGVMSAEELAGMELPSTGETPATPPVAGVLVVAVAGIGLAGWVVYRRRRAQ
ncbi:MAG: LPXTG cell wall anchor domain-containing protein [Anaerolineae bacterium]